jgi:uncharacterized Tic20 family protein
MSTSPSTEDRTWAALSHLSSLAFGMGMLLPIIGWSDRRRKSNYASFQMLQALGYQSLGFTIWVLSYLVAVILALAVLLLIPGATSGKQAGVPTVWRIVFSVVIVGFFAVYLILPIIAAIACGLGKDFHYPVLGKRLARYLGYEPVQSEPIWLNEDHEFRWVAACGHFSVLIMIWGMLAPLTTWMLSGKRSLFLRFQSLQTLVYQAGVTVLLFTGMFLYSAGIFVLFAVAGTIGQLDSRSSFGIAGIVVVAVLLLLGGLILLVVPLLHILGQWAGYRVLKGDNYRYPWVGRWVDKWITKPSGNG